MSPDPISGEFEPGDQFDCHTCRSGTVTVPSARWANSFLCLSCCQEYRRILPTASREDLDHLFGVKPSPYPGFGSF